MGGIGSGGTRPGSGAKPKSDAERVLHGTASAEQRKRAEKPVEVEEFDAPDDLTLEERLVWMRLAPHAFKARTLTPGTEFRFVRLCQQIVLEQALMRDVEQRGGANQRGVTQRVDAGMVAFGIAPLGKPMADEAPKVEDPFDEFSGDSATGTNH